ncbi:hypothetical protein DFS34DRAFT_593103 [Phlyctochytrium arcticum]|nr:hypothetical protein DFS34DRAFT_593103 [Phlyctochytrium arcticum]
MHLIGIQQTLCRHFREDTGCRGSLCTTKINNWEASASPQKFLFSPFFPKKFYSHGPMYFIETSQWKEREGTPFFTWRAFEYKHAPDLPISLRIYYGVPNWDPEYQQESELAQIYEECHEGSFFTAVQEFLANLDIVKEREVAEPVRGSRRTRGAGQCSQASGRAASDAQYYMSPEPRETWQDRRDIFCCMLPQDSWRTTAKKIAEALERQALEVWRLRTPLKLSILVRRALSEKSVFVTAVLAFVAIHGVERTNGVLEAFELLSDPEDTKSCELDSLNTLWRTCRHP